MKLAVQSPHLLISVHQFFFKLLAYNRLGFQEKNQDPKERREGEKKGK